MKVAPTQMHGNKEDQTREELVTRKATCGILKISEPTLDRWVRRGYLSPVQLPIRRRLFRLSDVQRLAADGLPGDCS